MIEIHTGEPDFPEKVHAHGFRHSKAMHMLAAGINIVYIRDFLGHEDNSTTMIYNRADNRLKNEPINRISTMPLPKIVKKLNQILAGYYHYYGITDNFKGIDDFCFRVRRSLFYWLNHRSQKKSYTWEAFVSIYEQ